MEHFVTGWPLVLVIALAAGLAQAQTDPPYPPPASPEDDSHFGERIQRTMTLLATSTRNNRHRVRILFYGQSITAQDWWKRVVADLHVRFPYADIEAENRAIGGFAAQRLVRTAEHDLYPFYPDLLIFHVYGDHRRYEDIIRRTRERTAAEIAIYTDHVGGKTERDEQGNFVDNEWTAFMAGFLKRTADQYGCELIEIRRPWKKYLRQNELEPTALLKDNIHPNEHGGYLFAELISRQLVYRPDVPADAWADLTETYVVGEDVRWQDGTLRLTFEGNRVDVIASDESDGSSAPVEVRIDGQRPSDFPELYVFTRPSKVHNVWPGIMRVSRQEPLILEQWTARITSSRGLAEDFTFEVSGSKTGFDGAGRKGERFVSDSGRVVIEADDWHLQRTCEFVKKPLPEGTEITWRVVPQFVDRWVPPAVENPASEYATTVAQGLTNAAHVVELRCTEGESAPIAAIRVYRPRVQP